MKTPQPRTARYFGMTEPAHVNPDGTWLEAESMTYPSGGFLRRAYVILRQNEHNPIVLPYGEMRIVSVSIPDTYFSIPARLVVKGRRIKGFVSHNEGVLTFTPEANSDICTVCRAGVGCKL